MRSPHTWQQIDQHQGVKYLQLFRLEGTTHIADVKLPHLNKTMVPKPVLDRQDLMDRENKCMELEVRKECADLRVVDHKEMFKTVFRNSVLRKEVMTPIDATQVDQYGTQLPGGYPQRDTVEEEKV